MKKNFDQILRLVDVHGESERVQFSHRYIAVLSGLKMIVI